VMIDTTRIGSWGVKSNSRRCAVGWCEQGCLMNIYALRKSSLEGLPIISPRNLFLSFKSRFMLFIFFGHVI